jgi:alkylation response protein AidB-like acyl-CoA dehydrogenase
LHEKYECALDEERLSPTRAPEADAQAGVSGMDFNLPDEIRILKDTVRKFVDRELIPIEMQSMDGPDLKPESRKALEAKTRELGLWLLEVPAELGGQDLSLLATAVINEELARRPVEIMRASLAREVFAAGQ